MQPPDPWEKIWQSSFSLCRYLLGRGRVQSSEQCIEVCQKGGEGLGEVRLESGLGVRVTHGGHRPNCARLHPS